MRTGAGFPSYNSSPASPSPEAATPYAQHNPYQSPLPFIFGGLAAMLSLCVFALLILACSYLRLSGYLDGSDADPDRRTSGAENQACAGPMPPPCLGEFVVIMAGDEMPTFLATPIRSRASSFADGGKDTAATSTAESASPTRAAVARTENSTETTIDRGPLVSERVCWWVQRISAEAPMRLQACDVPARSLALSLSLSRPPAPPTTGLLVPNKKHTRIIHLTEKTPKEIELFQFVKQVEEMTTISIKSRSDKQARKEYAEFEEKVKRTVFFSDLSLIVTSAVVSKALDQFGDVVNVEFISNNTSPYPLPQCALVEMKNPKQATAVITDLANYPFMMSGMPRPVRAMAAKAEMFADRPSSPDSEIQVRWVDPSDPDFEVGKKLKQLYKKHTVETMLLTKHILAEEEKLAKQQAITLEANYKKYEMTEQIQKDGSIARLASHYGINMAYND